MYKALHPRDNADRQEFYIDLSNLSFTCVSNEHWISFRKNSKFVALIKKKNLPWAWLFGYIYIYIYIYIVTGGFAELLIDWF